MKNALLRWYALAIALVITAGSGTAYAQCLDAWLYSRPINITNPGAAISNYFLIVKINTLELISSGKMRSTGSDLRFADAACNSLDYWIESGLNTATTIIWVKVPSVSSGGTSIKMFYGNPAATATTSAMSNIFGNGVAALYTFTQDGGTTLPDRSGNGFDMALSGITWGSGIRSDVKAIGGFQSGGRAFYNGTGPALGTGSWTAVTFINVPAASSGAGIIGSYPGDGVTAWLIKMQGSGNATFMNLTYDPATGGFCQTPAVGAVTPNVWQMVTGTRETGVTKSIYLNATKAGDMCPGDNRNVTSPNGPFELGRSYGGANPLNGSLSFAAVYTVAFTDNQVAALYNSLAPNPEPTTSVGAEVMQAPLITRHPVGALLCEGSSITFTVTAEGSNLSYQWRHNGVAIPLATSTSYAIPSVTPAHVGEYDVVVSNLSAITTTSSAALLSLRSATAFTTQPESYFACGGSPVRFSVTSSDPNVTYQWRKNGTPIPGAIASSYDIPSVSAASTGDYDVIATNVCGDKTTSNTGRLDLNGGPAITAHPGSLNLCRSRSGMLTVIATGTNLTYQWRRNGKPLEGENRPELRIFANPAAAGNYDVVVNGDCGTQISQTATLQVQLDAIITEQPLDQSVDIGDRVSFSVKTTGGGTLSYQWQKDGFNIPNATGPSYTIQSMTYNDIGDYNVVIHGTICNSEPTVSNKASLLVRQAPSIIGEPESSIACIGTPASFSITATGVGLSYQWRLNGTPIAGATDRHYLIERTSQSDVGTYDVVVRASYGQTLTSKPATLSLFSLPRVTEPPMNYTVCMGNPARFSVGTDDANVTYQWRHNGTPIPGATAASYDIASVDARNTGEYDVVITNTCGNQIVSDAGRLDLNNGPVITSHPVDRTVVRGESVIFTVIATGQDLRYQWRKNGIDIPGANSSIYDFIVGSSADDGVYDVVITDACGNTVSSNPAQISVSLSSAPLLNEATTGGASLSVIPNPARGSTRLSVKLPHGMHVGAGASLVLFDVKGHQVLDLSEGFAQSGFASVEFNASTLPSGTYYCRLTTPQWNGTLGSVVIEK